MDFRFKSLSQAMGNFSTIVQISNGICQYERKYAVSNKNICHFLGPSVSRARFPKKKPKQINIYKWHNAALWVFPQNALGDGPAFWIFFQDSRIRVNWKDLYMFLFFGFFFQKTRSVIIPKNGIYCFSARHISSHIGICHLKFAP